MLKLKVEEMSCGHCVKAVTEAANTVENVDNVEIDLEDGLVTITGTPDSSAVITAISKAGYPARQIA